MAESNEKPDYDWKPPTFEEYQKATEFARVRYKYGHLITLAAALALLFLIVFVISYGNELRNHPMQYAIKKLDYKDCTCNSIDEESTFYINKTAIVYRPNVIKTIKEMYG